MITTLRLLIVTPNVEFSMHMTRALEKTGGFLVTPFKSAENALEYLNDHPQHVALIDFTVSDMPGLSIVHQLRAIQPEIGVLIAPDTPENRQAMAAFNVQGFLKLPITARKLVPLVRRAASTFYHVVDETEAAPPAPPNTDTRPDPGAGVNRAVDPVEYWFSKDGRTVQRAGTPDAAANGPASPGPLTIFQKLAQEEPPLPGYQEGGTVSDLYDQLASSGSPGYVLADDDAPTTTGAPQDDTSGPTPASVILETAQNQPPSIEAFSVDHFVEALNRLFPENTPDIRPLPSWVKSNAPYVQEPDFLDASLADDQQAGVTDQAPPARTFPEPGTLIDDGESDMTTWPSTSQTFPQDPTTLETTPLEPKVKSRPPRPDETVREWPDLQEAVDYDSLWIDDEAFEAAAAFQPAADSLSAPDLVDDLDPSERAWNVEQRAEQRDANRPDTAPLAPQERAAPHRLVSPAAQRDPYLAQLALTLTQTSLEMAAEVILLTRGREFVAIAGDMPDEDIQEVNAIVGDDWWNAQPERTRLRFITLSSNGMDYMLYSRRTVNDFTLTMLFAGTLPLSSIRRQSGRIGDALASVPESTQDAPSTTITPPEPTEPIEDATFTDVVPRPAPPEVPSEREPEPTPQPEPEPAPEASPAVQPAIEPKIHTPYTYVWTLRDPNASLSNQAARAILQGLDIQLSRAGWRIQALDVHDDFVYLKADVPGEEADESIIEDVMRQAAEMVHGQQKHQGEFDAATLWADGYLAITPARDLAVEEIQQFLHFIRM